jgi:hypothetical protein
MMPGPTLIRRCSLCLKLFLQETISSGNTFGASWWTDGKMEAPMLPDEPWLVKCPHCGALLWIDEQEEVGNFSWGCVFLLSLVPLFLHAQTSNKVPVITLGTLRLQGIRLHSQRRTVGTYLIAMGYDLAVVKEQRGHVDLKTTLVYAKADKRLLEKAMRSVGELATGGYKMVTRLRQENNKPLIENE